MMAAVEHDSGWSSGWRSTARATKSRVRELSSSLDLAGRHRRCDARPAHGALPARAPRAVISAIKDNQETILEDLKAIDFSDAPWHETVDKGHGRIERRRCAAVDLSGAEWDGYANLHRRCSSNAADPQDRQEQHLEPHLARQSRVSFWPWSDWHIDVRSK